MIIMNDTVLILLQDNNIGDEGAKEIAHALQSNTSLTELNFKVCIKLSIVIEQSIIIFETPEK